MNLYAYVMNNPVNRADPSGLVDYDVDSQGDDLQQQKMRDAVAKKFGCYKNEAFIRDIGRNLRRTISKIRRIGGKVLGVTRRLATD